ncbi:hypothetical protein CEXT_354701 [Caerostris extrusa]|uniref:Uncharacterized protein n=1 Tax=Caerostris extrusa TaxID=172846 RepID=A0AAV4XNA4_CAEEX|nr:hypothetical protein CEXT_354701 [Caerostris extrusa]
MNQPLKCANCAGEHAANWRQCPRFPKKKQQPNQTTPANIQQELKDLRQLANHPGLSQVPAVSLSKAMLVLFNQRQKSNGHIKPNARTLYPRHLPTLPHLSMQTQSAYSTRYSRSCKM